MLVQDDQYAVVRPRIEVEGIDRDGSTGAVAVINMPVCLRALTLRRFQRRFRCAFWLWRF